MKRQVIGASIWTMAGFLVSQFARFAGNLILTRLLMPEYFGVMGLVSVFIAGVIMFSDIGIRQNIVQYPGTPHDKFLNTAWTLQFLRGLFVSVIIILLAFFIIAGVNLGYISTENVYGNPLLPPVLLAVSAVPLINGLLSTKYHIAYRDLELKPVIILEITAQIISLIVTIYLALTWKNIWALVVGTILNEVVKVSLTHIALKGPGNKFQLDKESAVRILHLGKWIVLSSITGFLLMQGDRLLIAGYVSAATLGIYTIAYFLSNVMSLAFQRITQSVFFPLLSEINRTEPHKIGSIYYKIRTRLDPAIFFSAGFMMSLGQLLIEILYDARYHDAGPMLQILSLAVIGSIPVLTQQLLLVTGHSKWMSVASIMQMILLFTGVPIAFELGDFQAALWVISLSFIGRYVTGAYYMHKLSYFRPILEIRFLFILPIGYAIGEMSAQLLSKILSY